jgi:4-hydroxy-tetrahydrodipicolinate synthase
MVSGSMVALVTPMASDGEVDFTSLKRLVDWHVAEGTSALVIAGTTGESATLAKSEHAEVIRVAAEHAGGRVPVIAGTGSNSTRQTIDLSQTVGDYPIDGYLIVTPYYNKPTQEGLYRHFSSIADAVDLPVMLYNVPARTGVDMLPETIARLAVHARVTSVKEATGEVARVARLRELCGQDFALFSGDDATAREFMLAGGRGVVSVTGNVAPAQMVALCKAATEGDADSAGAIDAKLEALHRDLFIESNPIPVKWALHKMGRIGNGIRLPLTWLESAHESAVERALRQAEVI